MCVVCQIMRKVGKFAENNRIIPGSLFAALVVSVHLLTEDILILHANFVSVQRELVAKQRFIIHLHSTCGTETKFR